VAGAVLDMLHLTKNAGFVITVEIACARLNQRTNLDELNDSTKGHQILRYFMPACPAVPL
jgi:hypothetical protein